METTLSDIVRHPATIAASVTAVLGGVLEVPVMLAAWSAFYSTSSSLFGALAVLSFIADFVPELRSTWVIAPMVIVGLVVLHKRATGWWEKFNEKL